MGELSVALDGERFTVCSERAEIEAFWRKADTGRWEGDTFRFVRKHASPQSIMLDVGAWIGPIALYASRFTSQVIALEPDPVAHAELIRNVRVNDANVDVWNTGIDAKAGTLELFAPSGLGQSVTSALGEAGGERITVRTVAFDDISQLIGTHAHVLLKVDIEGHEYAIVDQIIEFIQKHHAPLHLSLHPRAIRDQRLKADGRLGARLAAWRATRDLLKKLAPVGIVVHSSTGALMTVSKLTRLILLRRRLRNFSVEVVPEVARQVTSEIGASGSSP